MNKEETTKMKVKLPLITNEDIRVLDNYFGYIVNEVIKVQYKEREFALLQLIIKKQQQTLNEIREYMLKHLDLGPAAELDYYAVRQNILQIIDKVLGDER